MMSNGVVVVCALVDQLHAQVVSVHGPVSTLIGHMPCQAWVWVAVSFQEQVHIKVYL